MADDKNKGQTEKYSKPEKERGESRPKPESRPEGGTPGHLGDNNPRSGQRGQ